jgi:hypothetical protein
MKAVEPRKRCTPFARIANPAGHVEVGCVEDGFTVADAIHEMT